MKIGVNHEATTSYNMSTEKINHEATTKLVDNERTSSIEIKDHVKQNLGYQPTIQEKLIIDAIEKANQKVLGPQKEFEFAIHKETKQIMVKVIDKSTKEVIREIPPEKILDAVAHMCEIAGIFMDEKR